MSNSLYKKGLVPGKSSNVSCRFYENAVSKVAITRNNISKRDVTDVDVIIIDMDGNTLKGNKTPSSEAQMHLGIYHQRNDINGVVHTHSPYATGFSFAGKPLKRLEGFSSIKNPYITSVDYSPPGSIELARNTVEMMKKEDVVILKNHGLVAAGVSLDEAALLAEFIEDAAKTQLVEHLLKNK